MKKFNLLFALLTIYFSAFAQAPTITSFSPASGPVGTLVTIRGSNLSSPTTFTIGGVVAIVVSDNDSVLVGMVMPGADTGIVAVTTPGGSTYGGINFTTTTTFYPDTQQGSKLVGNGAVYHAQQGGSVAISADGSTAIIGGRLDNSDTGAAWIFVRTGSTWSQQGNKLVGNGCVNAGWGVYQGSSVAISADGNTVLVGGQLDNDGTGAVWVFIRRGTVWYQQGPKLVGSGFVFVHNFSGNFGVDQGCAVALSADGNTALVGGFQDSAETGAAWVFIRTDTTWTQQGPKLVGTGAVGAAFQGYSVALSADGNTAILGGPSDSINYGAVWIFERVGNTWVQQGNRLKSIWSAWQSTSPRQGSSVGLSADGNTAIYGGPNTNGDVGAAWVITRTGGTWSQGIALRDTNGPGATETFGESVALSADGHIALVGEPQDYLYGKVWVFRRDSITWLPQGPLLVGTGDGGSVQGVNQGSSIAISANGNYAISGGIYDGDDTGAAWIFGLPCFADSSHMTDSISANTLPYCWNGLTFTGAGTQTASLTGSAGCDSLVTLVLRVLPTGISEINASSLIHLYPNPNKGSFTLQTSNSIGSDYTISDMLGHIIMQRAIKADSEAIEMPDVSDGVYTLSLAGVQPIRFAVLR